MPLRRQQVLLKHSMEIQKKNHVSLLAIGAILLVTAIGLLLAFQAWNSRPMNFDHINFIGGADNFLSDWSLPERGDVSSYWAITTPGTAWLMLPGMLVFEDPRLYEFVGSAVLYFGTLVGLFLVTQMCFGSRCAYLSVLIYALSRSGLFFAGSLWSIGHPFFYVWMVYFCFRWVQQDDSKYLSAALVTWSVGMYVDMVLAPACFVFPALWLIYRPRIRLAPLVLAAAVLSVVWFPYLRLQTNRNFEDLKSLVMRHRLQRNDFKAAWCMPDLVLQKLNDQPPYTNPVDSPPAPQIAESSDASPQVQNWFGGLAKTIRTRYATLGDGLTFNFDQMAWTPLAVVPLVLLGMTTLALVALQAFARSVPSSISWNWPSWISRLAWVTLFLALLINESFVARFLSANGSLSAPIVFKIRTLQAILLIIGLGLLICRKPFSEFFRGFLARMKTESDPSQSQNNQTLFALCLFVPWLTLIMVVEPDNPVRYWWLWPMQIVPIIAAVTYIPGRFKWPRTATWIGQVAVILVLLSHPWLASPVQAWVRSGWSGPRADEIQALDYIASDMQSQGRQKAAIGYRTFIYPFMPAFNIVDPTYKVGAELDLYLKDRYEISNSNQCAEGISPQDEYRLVQTSPRPLEEPQFGGPEAPMEYFNMPLDSSYSLLRQFGRYEVFRRMGTR